MAVWTPYRYVSSGFMADVLPENPLLMFIESVVKLSASFGLVYLFLRLYGDSWSDVGIKRDWAGASLLLALIGSSLFVLPHLLLDGRLSPNPLGVAHLLLVVGPAEEIVDRGYFYGMIRSDLEGMRGLFFRGSRQLSVLRDRAHPSGSVGEEIRPMADLCSSPPSLPSRSHFCRILRGRGEEPHRTFAGPRDG